MGTIPLPIEQSAGAPGFLLYLTNTTLAGGGILGQAFGTDDRDGDTAVGVVGGTDVGVGVQGYSDSGAGVSGQSVSGMGVQGYSGSTFAVYGETSSAQDAAVAGVNSAGDGVRGTSNSPLHAGVSANNTAAAIPGTPSAFAIWAGGSAIGIYAEGTNHAAYYVGHVQHNGDVLTTGTHTVNGDIVLANNAGDCAEEFDVADAAEIEPGTVMVLDEHGAVRSSSEAYDKKVAGVISGAGDYRPGMILDKKDASEGRMPVALVGKVYCKVDAQYGPVEVGDLLTTSPTPGYAMKAEDPFKAFGSVIGKALRPLPAGQAMIPILIALQ